ncbi:MAG: hypothetical protein LUE11_03180 [Clostridia bacterium]|nr:hypothetical protein [Clostridia bacterium]
MKADLHHIVYMYLDDNPEASYNDIAAALGSPERMAEELLQDIPKSERYQTRRKRKRVHVTIVVALLVMVIAASFIVAYFIRNPYTQEVTTVVYEEDDNLPKYWDYAEKYGINYEFDDRGNIIRASDSDGNKIAVDQDGIPLDQEKYSLEEEEK